MPQVYAAVDIRSYFGPARAFSTFGEVVTVIVKNAFVVAGVISFLLLVFGGFAIIIGAGAGDTKKIEQGRQTLVGAIIGLLVVVSSFWIVKIIEKLTGVALLSPK